MKLALLIYRKTKLTAQDIGTGVNQFNKFWWSFMFAIARPRTRACASFVDSHKPLRSSARQLTCTTSRGPNQSARFSFKELGSTMTACSRFCPRIISIGLSSSAEHGRACGAGITSRCGRKPRRHPDLPFLKAPNRPQSNYFQAFLYVQNVPFWGVF